MAAEESLQQRLRALFAEELGEGLQLLSLGLLELEEQSGLATGAQLVKELFRTAHSLKGAAHAAAVPEAVVICDRLESAFAAVRDGERVPDAALVTQLLSEVDRLASLAAARPPQVADPAPPGMPADEVQEVVNHPAAPLRVTADKIDEVLRHATEGLASSRGLDELALQAAQVAGQVDEARALLRSTPPHLLPRQLGPLLHDAARAVTALVRTVEVTDRTLRHTSGSLAESVQRLRTQPFADACSGLDRVVRDVATQAGKLARLAVTGEEIEVDRSVVTALRDPLLHLVRNAVDHGLEAPGVRADAGKPATGTVTVEAALHGSVLQVTVLDDGAGIDAARLRRAATARGISVPAEDSEVAFVPGLSSRDQVTAVSGRGIGLDAARARLEQIGGSLFVDSWPGAGTQVRLTTPVTLAVLRVLLVHAGTEVVALPTSSVARVMRVDREALREVEGSVLLDLGSRSVRAVDLSGAVGLSPDPAGAQQTGQLGVVVPQGGDVVLVTDGLLEELEVAVQPVPARLAGAPGVLGVALTQTGLPAFVLNPVAVARQGPSLQLRVAPAPGAATPRILLAEDTVTTRALERSILEAAGYTVAVAVDGTDAWQQLQRDGADLVVSDVDMPRMSGFELCRRIRASARLRELPVILVTSLDSRDDRQRGLEAGADAYVIKAEFQQGTLLDTIARLL
jgi:two-component system chemotaxis sensor kinase CheA